MVLTVGWRRQRMLGAAAAVAAAASASLHHRLSDRCPVHPASHSTVISNVYVNLTKQSSF